MRLYTVSIAADCSTCFGQRLYPSSGAHTAAFTAFGTSRSVCAAISRCRGQIEYISVSGCDATSGVPRNFFRGGGGGGFQKIEFRTENGDLGAVAL
jgi:hypothetical protein